MINVQQKLAEMKFEPDRINAVNRFMHYEYPLVYYIILANSYQIRSEQQRHIDRELLARYLGVSKLTGGQMAALRKLDLDGRPVEIKKSIVVLTRHWEMVKKFVIHQPILNSHALILLYETIFNEPEVERCRWFKYGLFMDITNSGYEHSERYPYWYQTASATFLFKWYLLCERGINPLSLHSRNEMENCFEVKMDTVYADRHLPVEATLGVMDRVIERFKPYMRSEARKVHDLWAGDYEFNNSKSKTWLDETPFTISTLQPDAFFTQILNAGELRAIAKQLQNCAALRVDAGVSGKAEFWKYYDNVSGEMALLQIEPITRHVAEFNAFRNAGVGGEAKERLGAWLEHSAKLV